MCRVLLWVLTAILVLPSTGLTAVQDSTPAASPAGGQSLLAAMGYPELRIATDDTLPSVPPELTARTVSGDETGESVAS